MKARLGSSHVIFFVIVSNMEYFRGYQGSGIAAPFASLAQPRFSCQHGLLINACVGFRKAHLLGKYQKLKVIGQSQHGQNGIAIALVGIGNDSTHESLAPGPFQKRNGVLKCSVGLRTTKGGINPLKDPLHTSSGRHGNACQLKTPQHTNAPPVFRTHFIIAKTWVLTRRFFVCPSKGTSNRLNLIVRQRNMTKSRRIRIMFFQSSIEGHNGPCHIHRNGSQSPWSPSPMRRMNRHSKTRIVMSGFREPCTMSRCCSRR
mmetsp:Transcript_20352/g.36867  ORF Transcript_20352/g.36867 Transcript_20352/m.36867 type:complete len:259 (+) Transcript_20352:475-1251(+)